MGISNIQNQKKKPSTFDLDNNTTVNLPSSISFFFTIQEKNKSYHTPKLLQNKEKSSNDWTHFLHWSQHNNVPV